MRILQLTIVDFVLMTLHVCREAAKEAAKLNEYLNNPHQSSIMEEEILEEAKTLPPLQTNNSNHNFSKSALPVMHPGPTVEIREFTNINAVPNVLPASKNENEKRTDQGYFF